MQSVTRSTRFGFLKILVFIDNQFPHRDPRDRLKFNSYGDDSSNVAETVSKNSNFSSFPNRFVLLVECDERHSLAQSVFSPIPPFLQVPTSLALTMKHRVLKHQEKCHPSLPHKAYSPEMLCALRELQLYCSLLVFGGAEAHFLLKEKHAIK